MPIKLLGWAAIAGAFIPLMAILNARLGKSMGQPFHAPIILFLIGLIFCFLISLLFAKSLPQIERFGEIKIIDYLGGVIVAFYVISATLLAPRIGVANFIVCAVSAQILTSVVIDNFGLFGAAMRPVGLLKAAGILLLLVGIFITQMADVLQKGKTNF